MPTFPAAEGKLGLFNPHRAVAPPLMSSLAPDSPRQGQAGLSAVRRFLGMPRRLPQFRVAMQLADAGGASNSVLTIAEAQGPPHRFPPMLLASSRPFPVQSPRSILGAMFGLPKPLTVVKWAGNDAASSGAIDAVPSLQQVASMLSTSPEYPATTPPSVRRRVYLPNDTILRRRRSRGGCCSCGTCIFCNSAAATEHLCVTGRSVKALNSRTL